MRSSTVGVPMKYRPPESFEESSTCQTPTPAVRKQPSSNSCAVISKRGAKTMYILRQSLIGTVRLSLSI